MTKTEKCNTIPEMFKEMAEDEKEIKKIRRNYKRKIKNEVIL